MSITIEIDEAVWRAAERAAMSTDAATSSNRNPCSFSQTPRCGFGVPDLVSLLGTGEGVSHSVVAGGFGCAFRANVGANSPKLCGDRLSL